VSGWFSATAEQERSRRDRSFPGHLELLAALSLACLYFAVMSGHLHSIDGLLMYRQARSIVYDHSLRFGTPLWWGEWWTTSKFGLGLSLLYLPGVLVGSWLPLHAPASGGSSYDFALLYADPLYTTTGAPVHVLVTTASAYFVARFVRELGFDRGTALLGLAFYGVGSPAIVYARGDASQPLVGLCWIIGLYSAVRFRRSGRFAALIACSAAVCYAVLTRPVEGSMLLPTALLLAIPGLRFWHWPRQVWGTVVILTSSYLVGVSLTLLVNWGRFGSPFTTGYEGFGWTTPVMAGLAGALVSPGRGILWEFPAALLVPLGLRQLWRTENRTTGLALAGLAGLHLLNVATWSIWWGGWNWGLRLFLPALPLVAILAAVGVRAIPSVGRGWVAAFVLVAGVLWAVPGVVTDLLGGYAATYEGTPAAFRWAAYPPIGAWTFFHHWRAITPTDSGAADILWLRIARLTDNLSLVPLVLFGMAATVLGSRVLYLNGLPKRSGSVGARPIQI